MDHLDELRVATASSLPLNGLAPRTYARDHATFEANALGFRHLGASAGFRGLVTVGSSWFRACWGRRVVPGDGRLHGPTGA